ncbi:MAG: radical SAM protein [archaeon]
MILRKTKAYCPICVSELNASVVERKPRVFLERRCKKHGMISSVISNDSSYYRAASEAYFSLNDCSKGLLWNMSQEYYNLFLTLRCNLDCPICHVSANREYSEPSVQQITGQLKDLRNCKIGLFGGEPTLRDDLAEVIRAVLKSGNIPALHTNGIRLADHGYLKSLKRAGLVEVHLQFDGFSDKPCSIFRGKKLLDVKLRALRNLEMLSMPTILQVAVGRGINENNMAGILDYAAQHGFVRAILYKSYSHLGRAGLSRDVSLTIDEQIGIIEKGTDGRITKADVLNFQRLIYAFFYMLGQPRCFYNHYYVVRRNKGGYDPISGIMRLDDMQDALMDFIRSKNRIVLFRLLTNLNRGSLGLIYRAIQTLAMKRLGKHFVFGQSGLTRRYLIIEFGSICDMHNLDTQSACNCDGGEISSSGRTSSLAYGNIERERMR